MVFLYIFECMLIVLLGMGGPGGGSTASNPLLSTSELPTTKDVCVGVLGWLVVLIIFTLLVSLISYLINLTVQKKKNPKRFLEPDEQAQARQLQQQTITTTNSSFAKKLFYFLECLALGIICMVKGKNRPMASTHQPPTRKEVTTSVVGWLCILLIVLTVVILCLAL